jgi:hypothetical protein
MRGNATQSCAVPPWAAIAGQPSLERWPSNQKPIAKKGPSRRHGGHLGLVALQALQDGGVLDRRGHHVRNAGSLSPGLRCALRGAPYGPVIGLRTARCERHLVVRGPNELRHAPPCCSHRLLALLGAAHAEVTGQAGTRPRSACTVCFGFAAAGAQGLSAHDSSARIGQEEGAADSKATAGRCYGRNATRSYGAVRRSVVEKGPHRPAICMRRRRISAQYDAKQILLSSKASRAIRTVEQGMTWFPARTELCSLHDTKGPPGLRTQSGAKDMVPSPVQPVVHTHSAFTELPSSSMSIPPLNLRLASGKIGEVAFQSR